MSIDRSDAVRLVVVTPLEEREREHIKTSADDCPNTPILTSLTSKSSRLSASDFQSRFSGQVRIEF